MNKTMFKMFNLPNLITSGNMLCGILSIFFSISGKIELAPYPIFVGAFLDFLDGFFARILKIQSELGKQLDSLADMITFGLAPGIMMLMVLIITGFEHQFNISTDFSSFFTNIIDSFKSQNSDFIFFIWFNSLINFEAQSFFPLIALFIPFFSLFRLAKFNIDTRQSDSFIGLPTPANSLFFCTFPLVMSDVNHTLYQYVFNPYFISILITIMSILLVSEIKLFSLKFKHFKWKENEVKYLFLITCSLLIPLTLFWSLGIIVLLYLILSIFENIITKNKHEIQS
jgi:CDP-diacylglycerol---serine O-phosphatidyltransferase